MNKAKNAFVMFVVIVGLFVGYWTVLGVIGIVSNYSKDASSSYSFTKDVAQNISNGTFVEDINNGGGITNITNTISSNLSNKFVASKVTPDDISGSKDKLLDKINFNDINNPSSGLIDNISAEDVGIVSYINPSLINVVADSPKSITLYWNGYGVIEEPALGHMSDGMFSQNILNDLSVADTNNINNIALDFNKAYGELLKLKVPQSMVNFHKDNLLFFKNFSSVLSGLSDYKSDPLKAYILSQYLPKLTESWNEIGEFITKYAPSS